MSTYDESGSGTGVVPAGRIDRRIVRVVRLRLNGLFTTYGHKTAGEKHKKDKESINRFHFE